MGMGKRRYMKRRAQKDEEVEVTEGEVEWRRARD